MVCAIAAGAPPQSTPALVTQAASALAMTVREMLEVLEVPQDVGRHMRHLVAESQAALGTLIRRVGKRSAGHSS